MSRTICAGALVRDQIDIYNPAASFTRATGVVFSGLTATLFVNNTLVIWPLADGTSVADSSISAGYIYFNEISGSSGFYNIRFFPNTIGFWRLVFRPTLTSVDIVHEFDVVPSTSGNGNSNGALNATFIRP